MAKSEKEVFQHEAESPLKDIPAIVGKHIANIMRDPTAMRAAEVDLDAYIQAHPEVKDPTKPDKMAIRKQLIDGGKICESLLQRFLVS